MVKKKNLKKRDKLGRFVKDKGKLKNLRNKKRRIVRKVKKIGLEKTIIQRKENWDRKKNYEALKGLWKNKKETKGEIGRKILKGTLEKGIKIKKELPKIKTRQLKPRKIDTVFKRSVAKLVIQDFLPLNTSEINNQYRELFSKIVKDKDLMDILITQENIKKINWRFEIRSTIYGLKGERLAEISKGSGGDLMELRSLMQSKIWKGELLDYPENPNEPIIGNGYTYTFLQKGNVTRVETRIVFRS